MRILPAFLFFLLATGLACKKAQPGENQYTTFYYHQTGCSDPWPTGATDSLTLVNVSNYLSAAGVYVASLNIKQDGIAEACLACQCKTSKTIYVSAFNNKGTKEKYLALGFKQ